MPLEDQATRTMRFKDQVAIVTGGTRGIGRACAIDLAAEGAHVVIAGRNEQDGKAIAAETGGTYVRCDVSKAEDVATLVGSATDRGPLTVVVNCAGLNHRAGIWETTEADWDHVINVDLKGTFLVTQAAARRIVAEEHPAAVVNFSSIMATIALADQIPYCAAKGGVNQLTKSLALALARYDIRVNCCAPGPVLTELMEVVVNNDEKRKELLDRVPMGRIGEPAEIARVVTFLASDDSSFMTGQTVYVDGGRIIQAFPRRMET